jgi:hypothetical protein
MARNGGLSCARLLGAGLLLASVCGFLIYDINIARKFTETVDNKVRANTPGLGTRVRDSTIVILLFSAIIAIFLLFLLLLTACGVEGRCSRIFWLVTAGLFIPVLVSAALATERTKFSRGIPSVVKLEDRNVEYNEDVKEYVEGLKAYDLARARDMAEPRSPGEVRANLNRSINAETILSEDEISSFCNPWSEADLVAVKLLAEGALDKWSSISGLYTYIYHADNQKIPLESDHTFLTNVLTSLYPTFPSLDEFYTSKDVPPCYGLKADEDSVTEAIEAKDPCKVVLKAKECAPGWTVELLAEKVFCSELKECKEDLPRGLRVWENILKAEKTENPLNRPLPLSYKLPRGWNELEAFEKYQKEEWAATAARLDIEALGIYHYLNFAFLVAGSAGLVFILIGTIAAMTTGEGAGDGADSRAIP